MLVLDAVTARDESGDRSAPDHDLGDPVPTAVVETPAARGFVSGVTEELRRLPSTVRFGLAILGLFGFADVVAHVGVPVTAGGGSTSDRQLVAHLGVLAGMVVVLGGVLRDTRPRATSRPARRSDEGNPAPKATDGQSRAVAITAAGPADAPTRALEASGDDRSGRR